MSLPAPQRVERIFHDALQQPPGTARQAFLDGALAEVPHLRERVEALLAAHEEAESCFLEPPTKGPGDDPDIGSNIGPYKLLQEIGSGGMGVVYMAEQERPVRRKVALKVIKLGMDTKQVVARFEAERQALALMDHAHIARVLDAGATQTGRPYFVMELVRGVPINEYCEAHKLAAKDRIELFIDVCRGIQHAHQKGIIHRDIKPGNVLVTLHDGQPVPKIIDFGVAKAMNQRLTEKTLFTEFKQFIGTPEYMSPEQAEMSGLDVDTRSDIYSLGVLLYELLTGTTPVDGKELRTAGYGEMTRMIREKEPLAPSTQVSKLGTTAGLAKQLGSDPGHISRLFRGDLDWIVMRALEKDRTRRYDTAASFADDLERHLHNRPIEAGPPSSLYRLRKFLQRNRRAMVLVGGIALALVLGLIGTTAGFLRARDEARRSGAMADSLQDLLMASDPARIASLEFDPKELLASSQELFGAEHATVAAVTASLAKQLTDAGRFEEAEVLQREALRIWRQVHDGDEHMNVALSMANLGELLLVRGKSEESEQLLRRSLEILEGFPGGNPVLRCDPMEWLAQLLANRGEYRQAIELVRGSVEIRRQAPGQEYQLQVSLEQLVKYAIDERDDEVAIEGLMDLRDEVLRMHPTDSFQAVTSTFGVGNFLYQTGRRQEAEPYLRTALEGIRRSGRTDGAFYLIGMDALFQIIQGREDDESRQESARLLADIITQARPLWDPERTALNLSLLADLLGKLDRWEEAFSQAAEAYRLVQPRVTREMLARYRRQFLGCALDLGAAPVGPEAHRKGLEILKAAFPEPLENHDEWVARLALAVRGGLGDEVRQLLQDLDDRPLEPDVWLVGMRGPVHRAVLGMARVTLGDPDSARQELTAVEAYLDERSEMDLVNLRAWRDLLQRELQDDPQSDG